MRHLKTSIFSAVAVSLLFLSAPFVRGQIIGQVEADIHHRFIVANATLPPGHYTFHMLTDSDLQVMTATSADGNEGIEFLVRRSVDSHMPKHTELIFNRYGNKEFLTHIYVAGDKTGVAVSEPSREEMRLKKQGQSPFEHTEEQAH